MKPSALDLHYHDFFEMIAALIYAQLVADAIRERGVEALDLRALRQEATACAKPFADDLRKLRSSMGAPRPR
jgi:hypothetical protein